MTRKYPVLYEWSGRNFSGFAPDIPGCIATAKTLKKMRQELAGALAAHLQWMQNDGEAVPSASTTTTIDLQDDPDLPNPPGYYVVVEWLDITLPKAKTKRSSSRKQALSELAAA